MPRSTPRATPLLAMATVVALVVALGPGAPGDDDRRSPLLADAPGAAAGEHPTVDVSGPEIAELRARRRLETPGRVARSGRDSPGYEVGPRDPGEHPIVRPPDDTSANDGTATSSSPDDEPAAPTMEPAGTSEEGFVVAPGDTASGDGPTVRYTVEVEPGIGEDLAETVAVVEEALHDPRGWAADIRFERTADPDDARIRVLLASPGTVDRLCAEVGLETVGVFSCWNQTFAALNSMRWNDGADAFGDLRTYRHYLVNHEVGHGLGQAHVDCPGPGEPAPVMMQQTLGTDGCVPNGWVYPDVAGR